MRNIAKRHAIILEELKRDGYVRVQDLSEMLNVSEVTIRKDLKDLESRKMLYRNHGSASSINSLILDKHIDEKEKICVDEKRRIAELACKLLEPNDRIIIGSGTTLLAFAKEISQKRTMPLTVITASLKVSLALCYNPLIEIIQLGGMMRSSSASVIGSYAESILREFACYKAFIGIDGMDMDYGLTTSNMGEAHLNQCMLQSAQKTIVLTDSSKFGKRGFNKICDLNQVHQIITDSNASAKTVSELREKGIEVMIV